jgi:hypothetical protein
MLNVIMPSVVMSNVITLNIVAPKKIYFEKKVREVSTAKNNQRQSNDIPMVPMTSGAGGDTDDADVDEGAAGSRPRVNTTSFFNPSYEHNFNERLRRTSLGCFNQVSML